MDTLTYSHKDRRKLKQKLTKFLYLDVKFHYYFTKPYTEDEMISLIQKHSKKLDLLYEKFLSKQEYRNRYGNEFEFWVLSGGREKFHPERPWWKDFVNVESRDDL